MNSMPSQIPARWLKYFLSSLNHYQHSKKYFEQIKNFEMKGIVALFLMIYLFASCNNESKHCKEQFIREYKNELGHYYGSENRIVYEDNLNTKLSFRVSKNYNGTNDIKLIFYSKSNQMHFAADHNQNDKLYIRVGNIVDTVTSKIYKRDKEAQSQFEETISYEIPATDLQNLLDNRYSYGGEITLSNYHFIISDEIACSLYQIIKIKK